MSSASDSQATYVIRNEIEVKDAALLALRYAQELQSNREIQTFILAQRVRELQAREKETQRAMTRCFSELKKLNKKFDDMRGEFKHKQKIARVLATESALARDWDNEYDEVWNHY